MKKRKKTIYEYLERGEFVQYDKPKKTRQFGFFGTRKNGYGEVHWDDGSIVRRASSRKKLFAWLHDNVLMPCWGDMSIKKIK